MKRDARSTVARRPTRRWSGRAAWGLHLGLAAGLALCGFAGWFELTRALSGHIVAWVYVVEWPMFGVIGCYIWWRLLADAPAGHTTDVRAAHRPAPGGSAPEDPELEAWQRYLAQLQADDPPGQPPMRRSDRF